jgi:transposase
MRIRAVKITFEDVGALPDDPKLLKEKLREAYDAIQQLAFELSKLQRQSFGRKSERVAHGQQIFPFAGTVESCGPSCAPEESERKRQACASRKGKPHKHRLIPPELPRVAHVHDLPENERICPGCRNVMGEIGRDVSEQLECEHAKFYAIQDIRIKYGCGDCKEKVAVADPPVKPIAKGLAGPGLLAQILVGKYADHLPLYRQEAIYRRHGIHLPRSTMCGWVGQCVDLLRPVYEAMNKDVLASKVIKTDDTPVRMLEPGRGETRKTRLWVYVGDETHRQAVYDFTLTHENRWPKEFLKNYIGHLQADAYKGYDALFKGGTIIEVGCWMHARRYFFDAEPSDKARALYAIEEIRKLYEVERIIEQEKLVGEERRKIRQERSRPVLEAFKKWLDEQLLQVLPKSPIGQAMQYARGQWEALNRYVEVEFLGIDNGAAERALRGISLGRKNYMFLGSEGGGEWAAMMYSLIHSCQLNGVDPYAYLKDLLIRLPTFPIKRIEEMMPRNWKPAARLAPTSAAGPPNSS